MRKVLLSRPVLYGSIAATAIGATCLIKDALFREKPQPTEQLTDKVVIVTGANRGIGQAVTHEFAKRDAKVVMACRDMKLCEKARIDIVMDTGNKYVYCRPCDLASQESIRQFVKKFKSEHKDLHFLINNAGIMKCKKGYTKEGIEMQLGVNFMGHFLLTNLLLDTLKASAPSKILNVSNIFYTKGSINVEDLNSDQSYDPTEAYYQSQVALAMFTRALDAKLGGTNVTVNSVYPGLTNTDITRHMSYQKSIFGRMWVKPLTWFLTRTPKQAAYRIISAALDPNYKEMSGVYFQEFEPKPLADNATKVAETKWLWKVAEKWTHLDTAASS